MLTLEQLVERNLSVDQDLRVIDDAGNEWRDEDGAAHFLQLTDQTELETEGAYLVRESVWITIGNKSVRLYKTDEGVVCDMYPLGYEMDEAVASTYAFFNE